jgi:hypothetical protein
MELFLSDFTSKAILTEVSLILPIVVVKSKSAIGEGMALQIKDRIEKMMKSALFDEATNNFLEQSLLMFGKTNEI